MGDYRDRYHWLKRRRRSGKGEPTSPAKRYMRLGQVDCPSEEEFSSQDPDPASLVPISLDDLLDFVKKTRGKKRWLRNLHKLKPGTGVDEMTISRAGIGHSTSQTDRDQEHHGEEDDQGLAT